MPVPMTVTELLDPKCVVVPLAAANKREAIDALVDAMASPSIDPGRVDDLTVFGKASGTFGFVLFASGRCLRGSGTSCAGGRPRSSSSHGWPPIRG